MPVLTAVVSGCLLLPGCSKNDYYQRDPYVDGRKIESSLLDAQNSFAAAVSASSWGELVDEFGAPAFRERMKHYVARYGGHPTRVISRSPGDDATANLSVLVSCAAGHSERIGFAWAWFDDAWRAWPDYKSVPDAGDPIQYPGCDIA